MGRRTLRVRRPSLFPLLHTPYLILRVRLLASAYVFPYYTAYMEHTESTHVRPSWDEYFMSIAELVGSRATCDRGRSGCVVARDKQILVTGYVGAPIGLPHCDDVGHEMSEVINSDGSVSEHCIRSVHAEQNALTQAAKLGVALEGATLYCHMTPCYACAKMLINAGIKKVVAKKDYHRGQRSKEIFRESGISLTIVEQVVEDYSKDRFAGKTS